MISLDTNVLARFLVQDDPGQHRRARRLVQRAIDEEEPLVVTPVVLCELAWVLTYSYRFPRATILATLRSLLHTAQLHLSSKDAVSAAIERFASGRGDFADYLILEQSRAAGATAVATFDRALLREPGFVEP